MSTDQTLYVAVNNAGTILSAGIDDTVTTIPVVTTAAFPADGIITIEAEAIHYTSKNATNFLGATRGFDGTTNVAHLINDIVEHNAVAAHHNSLKDAVIAAETDIATRALDSAVVHDTGNESIAGIKDFTTQVLGKGTDTNDSAASGYVGEVVKSVVGNQAIPASGVWGDITSITLSAGDWDITALARPNIVVATTDVTALSTGISVDSGTSFTDNVSMDNSLSSFVTAGNDAVERKAIAQIWLASIPAYRVSLSGSTIYYLKMQGTYVGSGSFFVGRISARRIR